MNQRFLSTALTLVGVCFVTAIDLLPAVAQSSSTSPANGTMCPAPALSRVARHRIQSGETIVSIAQQYDLIPATLLGFNPVLRNGNAPVGTEINIPPYNGVRVDVPSGSTWRDVARSYNVRADVLFEINGCQEAPNVVFVPGVNWSPQPATPASAGSDPLNRYPLPAAATVLRGYGWQLDGTSGQVVFNSGIDLEAPAGTAVLATGAGTIAFAAEQGNYGKLVVINHSQGLQTRYAQLESINVQVGQQVQAGDRIGTVGATGAVSSPRLHFEVRTNSDLGWVAQDPGTYVTELKGAERTRRAATEQ
ncbi:M23 family metallopeptidase [Phormidium tenue FACHB-886]|nr:M23 family metallopeptidase [Phormidium tenue FACHB-886]